MKNFILFIFSSLTSLFLFAQTGPGGVGNSTNIEAWLDASSLTLLNNDPVNSWTDLSGNNNNADQTTSADQPTFKTNEINGLPVIEFDGNSDFLTFNSHITTDAITNFLVYKRLNGNSLQGLLTLNKHILFSNTNKFTTFYSNPNAFYNTSKTDASFSVSSHFTDNSLSGSAVQLTDANTSSTFTRNELINASVSKIATNANNNRFFDGQIAECIIINERLTRVKRRIISQYLASKYNLTASFQLYAFGLNYGNNVIGVGMESSGDHTVSRGQDSLEISNPSTLNNGDYILIGNDGAGYDTSNSVPNGAVERWEQVWKIDKTGSPGNIDLEFFLGSNGFASVSDYAIFIESDDGDFSNGGVSYHTSGRTYNAIDNSIKFTGVNLSDGDHFTLGELSGNITAIASDSWEFATTWSCLCVPGASDIVTIPSPFEVSVDNNASVLDLTVESGAGLAFDGSDSLFVAGDLIFENTSNFTSNNGTLIFNSPGSQQLFINNSGSSLELNNLIVNNVSGLSLDSGDWGISNNLQVVSGGLDVTNANTVTLRSTPTKSSQILESMSDAFSGNFIVQRYISSRNADWANFSSPVENATAADWDDDLYISGVNGNDGNVLNPDSSIFYTLYWFNWWTDEHITVTDTSEALLPGRGYDIYLGDNNTSYFGDTIDVVGVPNSGDVVGTGTRINKGWNLMGNPYHSFIDYDDINFNGTVPDNYYIFNTDNGSYDFFSGVSKPDIAPGQGFWIFKSNNGIVEAVISETAKVNSNSSSFLRRQMATQNFKLSISNNQNPFKHQLNIQFNAISTEDIDQNDAYYLESRQEGAPAIYSKAANSEEGLILNSLNPFEQSQLIPIEIYAGVDGTYKIDAENLNELYNDYSCVYLKDKTTSEAIDLSVEQSYQFETSQGTSDRFELIVSNSYTECEKLIEDASFEQKLDHQMSLRNAYGQWFVDYTLDDNQQQVEIHILNMAGQEVKEAISFGASNAGTYPLQNLQDLNGIYLIQVKTKDGFINKTVKL
ncbi:MAG: T9SS type A sorting domain-containing protein [Vicingaceae bacterium]